MSGVFVNQGRFVVLNLCWVGGDLASSALKLGRFIV